MLGPLGELLIAPLLAFGVAMGWLVLPRPSPKLPVWPYHLVFYLSALATWALFSFLAILRHHTFHSNTFDLGIFDQVVWNTAQGRLYENSIMFYSPNLLGNHFTPFLLLLAPAYWVAPHAETLLVLQALALVVAAFPLYWLGVERLGPGPLPLALGLAYFLFPPLLHLNLADFHEIAFAVPFLSYALFFLLRRRWRPFLLSLGLALLIREEIGLIAAAFGLLLIFQGKRPLGLGLVVLGMLWAYLTVMYLVPYFQGTTQYIYFSRYAYLGQNLSEIITTILFRPGYVLSQVATWERAQFVLQLLSPLAFLSVLTPEILWLAFPTFGYTLLSGDPALYDITSQYHAPIVPFLFFAALVGLERLARLPRPSPSALAGALSVLLLVSALGSYGLHSPGPLGRLFAAEQYRPTERTALGHALLAQIPPNASVMAQGHLAAHLAQRRELYMFPWAKRPEAVDYLVFDRRGNSYPYQDADDLLREIERLRTNASFRTVVDREGYLLLKGELNRRPEQELGHNFGDRIALVGYEGFSSQGRSVGVTLFWQASQPMDMDYTLFVHLVDAQNLRRAQVDRPPTTLWYPTSQWQPGALRHDRYELELPPDLPSGDYRLLVGLYDPHTLQRLPVLASPGAPQTDHVVLGPLRLGP